MKKLKRTKLTAKVFSYFSILSITYVSILSMVSPQSTMDLVHVTLENTDAISSIRGVYGGVGLTIAATVVVLTRNALDKALLFLGVFWGMYALSRTLTIIVDGSLGDFGTNWLMMETLFSFTAFFVWYRIRFLTQSVEFRNAERK